ncbi:MAG: HNH endonuclease [Rhodospirillaceae bacterium]|nr:HNH endonuclease [Rhodospirillaceae bacterium]
MVVPPTNSAEIKRAIRKFDQDLRDAPEWKDWELKKNYKFALQYEGQSYPVKMILSLATGIDRNEFSGGKDAGHANSVVEDLGFKVIDLGHSRNPAWLRDELILALDLYLRHRDAPPGKTSKEVVELSKTLNELGMALGIRQDAKFRNANGVYMKMMNFRALDPQFTSEGKVGLQRGGRLDKEIWETFADNSHKCNEVAELIRSSIESGEANIPLDDDDADEDFEEAPEGKLITRLHRRRERSRKLVKKKAQVLNKFGRLKCEVCEFDFHIHYGDRGEGFIECHHTKPVTSLKPGAKTKLVDLSLLCANCHRMIHVRKPWLSIKELSDFLKLKTR